MMKKTLLFTSILTLLFTVITNAVWAKPIIKHHPESHHAKTKVIEGYYVSEPMDGETEHCDLSVKIIKVQGKYTYTFKVNRKIIKGKVKLAKGDEPDNPGIIFEGMEWAENNGDVSNGTANKNLKKPGGVDGVWTEDGIMIQNYGNSMNNYLKIASCGQKFIHLIKR